MFISNQNLYDFTGFSDIMMEVIKCGLCKEEIEYAQRCRVYIETNEPRPYQRISKRPHIGRFKLISTAKSTEHISFARRLKRIRVIKDNINSGKGSTILLKVYHNTKPSIETKGKPKEHTCTEESEPLKQADIDTNDECLKKRKSALFEKTEDKLLRPELNNTIAKESLKNKPKDLEPLQSTAEEYPVEKVPESANSSIIKPEISEKTATKTKFVERKSTNRPQNIKKLSQSERLKRRKMNHPHFQSSFEEYIKPSLSKNNLTPNKEIKQKNSDLSTEFDQHKKMQVTSTPKSVKNGSINNTNNSDCETYYWLEMPKPKQPELRKLGYDFENLVTEVKHMKLPNTDWKIKIMVHKQEMVSVSFTKKVFPEKIVSVNAKNSVCDIAMDGKRIILSGSPIYIHSIKDLEVMLDIVNDIEPDSPMITYLKSV